MGMRTTRSQTAHDAEVRRTAKALARQGFEVAADVRGFKQPKTIGGMRPDIIGTKGLKRKIIEVETADSVASARDIKQRRAFKTAAARAKHTTFTRKVVKK